MSGGLARYIAGRLVRALLTVLGIVTLVFLLVRLTPGDPVDTLLGDQAAPEDRAALRAALHLDASLPRQYVGFVGDVVDGSLGQSFRRRQVTVSSLIVEVAAPTLWLAVSALLVSWMIAIPVGCIAAARRGTAWDRNASTLAMVGLAVPTIVLGPLLILLFAVQLRWLPLPGDDEAGLLELILPAVTVGSALAAILMRQTRAAMIESLGQPYVLAARARGVAERNVLLKHALRNAMLPVLTVGGAQLGALLSGLVVVERIFERRGLGSLLIDAALSLDYPVVQGCVLVIGTIYVLVNLFIDLLYGVVDPRVRLS